MKKPIKPELMQAVLVKCISDQPFKERLIKNPQATLKNEMGIDVPQGLKVIEDTENTRYLVLPHLNAQQLEQFEQSVNALQTPEKSVYLLMIKCLKDKSFKNQLLENPKKVISEECTVSIPEQLNYQVVEDSDTLTYLLIPDISSRELTDAEIAHLSGGLLGVGELVTAIAVAGATVGVAGIAATGFAVVIGLQAYGIYGSITGTDPLGITKIPVNPNAPKPWEY